MKTTKNLGLLALIGSLLIGVVAFSGCVFWGPEEIYNEGQELKQNKQYEDAINKFNIIIVRNKDNTLFRL